MLKCLFNLSFNNQNSEKVPITSISLLEPTGFLKYVRTNIRMYKQHGENVLYGFKVAHNEYSRSNLETSKFHYNVIKT